MAKVRDSDRESNVISNFLGDSMSLAPYIRDPSKKMIKM